jgi:hypothetical protein
VLCFITDVYKKCPNPAIQLMWHACMICSRGSNDRLILGRDTNVIGREI